jgi:FMN phosphatase YigB (HAD superfamily)
MTVRAILFDVGDTLLRVGRFEPDLGPRLMEVLPPECDPDSSLLACRRAFEALGKELADGYAAGREDEDDIGAMLVRLLAAEGLPVTPEHAGQLGDVVGHADVARLEPRAGVAETLNAFSDAGYRLAAVSNTGSRSALLDALYESCGLAPSLECRVYSSSLGVRKPHPRLYATALEALGVSGEEAVFVGDRVREDIAGPRRARVAHAVLTHEYRQEDPGDSNPCAIITRLEDLHAILPTLH